MTPPLDLPTAPERIETAHGLLVLVPIADTTPAVRDDERALAATYAQKRLRTFAAGREAMRAALALDVAIARTDRGAPVLPAGWRGSITHKDEVAGALALRSDDDITLGVDLELVGQATRDIASHVLLPHELDALAREYPDDADARAREVLVRFSLKEAFYKAIDPRVRRFVGFHEVTVELEGERARFISDVVTAPAEGRVLVRGGVIVTSVMVRWS